MRTGRKSNNQGFSLVEMIIVIAIMAIMITTVGLSLSLVSGRKVKKCADEIVSTIERTRVLSLGKDQGQVEFILSQDASSGEYHVRIYQGSNASDAPVQDRIVGKDPIEIKVLFSDRTEAALGSISGNTPHAIHAAGENGLRLIFNRASGAFEKGTNAIGSDVKTYCDKIVVTGSGRTIEITTVGATGKILQEEK